MNEQLALKEALQSRIESLRLRYPRYSIRAFAKKAGVSPATLSLILQGKRKISEKLARQLSERLLFDPQERSDIIRACSKRQQPAPKSTDSYVQLTQDQYKLISDWRAFALLNLISTHDFKNDVKWISTRLGIASGEVKETILRLKRLGMLHEEQGQFARSTAKYRTTEDVANLSLRRSHQQTLELAMTSLENDPVERRDFTWVTLPLDLTKLADAKTLIRKFQDDLLALVERDAEPGEVYRLAIQLFPLTKIKPARKGV